MSAYICNPEHIGILAAYAAKHECAIAGLKIPPKGAQLPQIYTAQVVAQLLAAQNIRSVAHRYPHDKDGKRPGPRLKDADIAEAAAIYAAHFVKHWPANTSPLQILSLAEGYEYQASETDDWNTTRAAQQIKWIVSHAIRSLPGYDVAPWSFNHPLPEVEALYGRNAS